MCIIGVVIVAGSGHFNSWWSETVWRVCEKASALDF